MKYFEILILLLVGILVSCDSATESEADFGAVSTMENPFVAAGLPASDSEWNGPDYRHVARAIRTGKAPLPLIQDEFGSRVLNRLTNTENFALNRNMSLPLDRRLGDFMELQQGQNAVLKVYFANVDKGQDLHDEVAVLIAFGLQVAALGVELVNEFLPTVPKDEKYEIRMEGLRRMNMGVTTTFAGAATSISESHFYSKDDLSKILTAMHSTLPILKQAFTEEYKGELRVKLTAYRKDFSRMELELIDGMVEMLGAE